MEKPQLEQDALEMYFHGHSLRVFIRLSLTATLVGPGVCHLAAKAACLPVTAETVHKVEL